jgi:hypothetical protein
LFGWDQGSLVHRAKSVKHGVHQVFSAETLQQAENNLDLAVKPITILLPILTVSGLGLVAATLRPAPSADTKPQPAATVVVAKANISIGTTVRQPEALFAVCERSLQEIPPEALMDLNELKHEILKKSVREGQILTKADLLNLSWVGAAGRRLFGISVLKNPSPPEENRLVDIYHHKDNEPSCKRFSPVFCWSFLFVYIQSATAAFPLIVRSLTLR